MTEIVLILFCQEVILRKWYQLWTGKVMTLCCIADVIVRPSQDRNESCIPLNAQVILFVYLFIYLFLSIKNTQKIFTNILFGKCFLVSLEGISTGQAFQWDNIQHRCLHFECPAWDAAKEPNFLRARVQGFEKLCHLKMSQVKALKYLDRSSWERQVKILSIVSIVLFFY